MKKINVYIRIGKNTKTGYKTAISTKPNPAPLYKTDSYMRQIPLTTIRFGVEINIPDDAFDLYKTINNKIQINVSAEEVK